MARDKCGKILIVDDNEDVLLSLNMLLKPYVEAIELSIRLNESSSLWIRSSLT